MKSVGLGICNLSDGGASAKAGVDAVLVLFAVELGGFVARLRIYAIWM